MKSEERIIKASLLAGVSDILIGIIFYLTGFADWYFAKLHFFGILGLGMLWYAFWHNYLYKKDLK